MKVSYLVLIVLLVLAAFFLMANNSKEGKMEETDIEKYVINFASGSSSSIKGYKVATFAGGCFWCSESDFEKKRGVKEVVSGYSGGGETNPSYGAVSSGATGHRESVQVIYDPKIISYKELLDVYWRHIDPTDEGGSFVDRGKQYTSAIFYHDEEQKRLAEESLKKLEEFKKYDKRIVTPILKFSNFYLAEKYHQDYHKKNPLRYKFYRSRSGRDQYIEKTWGSEDSKKSQFEDRINELTPLQYKVTQENGTERAFDNEYWDNKEEGIYVDIVSGEPLFSSTDKFVSGTGWPSFTRPLVRENTVEREDKSLFLGTRIEVRSKMADSHLGHIFDDGPKENGGLRYCINSAALRFIPKENLKRGGYGEFLGLFE